MLRSYYKSITKTTRKLIAHKRSRLVFHVCLIIAILFVGIFPYSRHVFGQVEIALSGRPIATEEVILTTKRTSKLPVVGPLSQGFTYYHPGIDMENPMNSPIYPFLQGVVFEAGFQGGGYGNYVLIDHQNGYFSLYAHLHKILVKKDDEVSQDTVIGTVGVTGYSTGSHVHFEIYENGFAVNPLAILPELPSASAHFRSFTGGPNTYSRPLILPISKLPSSQDSLVSQQSTNEKKEEKKEEYKKALGIWLPNEIKTPVPQEALDLDDSKVNHRLPTLDGVLQR